MISHRNGRFEQIVKIPTSIWVLGLVSMLMDISSEMIHSLLPLFMVSALGASAFTVGMIEGLAESTALIVKVFSGTFSNYLQKRKGLALLGYALGALTKPLFAMAPGIGMVLIARLLDRVGKGIRGAPRDALVAELSPPSMRGAAFGLRQSLDTVGAFLGPLLAVGLMLLWGNYYSIRTIGDGGHEHHLCGISLSVWYFQFGMWNCTLDCQCTGRTAVGAIFCGITLLGLLPASLRIKDTPGS